MDTKQSLRQKFRACRNALSHEEREASSASVLTQLLAMPQVRDVKSWFVYVSTGSEVATHALIRTLLERSQVVAVPCVVGEHEMLAQRIESFNDLRPGAFGILEPPSDAEQIAFSEVAVCPGTAFTMRGERLGSGVGFYDRYLATNPPRLAIGLAFECQIAQAEVPVEAYDRPMDYVVTERRVIARNA